MGDVYAVPQNPIAKDTSGGLSPNDPRSRAEDGNPNNLPLCKSCFKPYDPNHPELRKMFKSDPGICSVHCVTLEQKKDRDNSGLGGFATGLGGFATTTDAREIPYDGPLGITREVPPFKEDGEVKMPPGWGSIDTSTGDVVAVSEELDFSDVPLDRLATMTYLHEKRIAEIRDNHARELRGPNQALMLMKSTLVEGMTSIKAKILSHESLTVTLEQKKDRDKKIDVLRKLHGVVPSDALAKAFTVDVVLSLTLDQLEVVKAAISGLVAEDKIKTNFNVNGTHLKPLAKYGEEAAQIIEAGYPEIEVGSPILKIVAKPGALKNVTPLGEGLV